jgi:hypothetical protein
MMAPMIDEGGWRRFPPGVTKGMLRRDVCEYADLRADL